MRSISRDIVRLDPMGELFLHMEEHVNVHSNQLLVVGGRVDHVRLARAVAEAVARFPILLAAPEAGLRTVRLGAYRPEDVPVRERAFGDGPMAFDAPAFRRFVMGESHREPVRWRFGPPVAVTLIASAAGERSCVLLSTSHAVADAASDSRLFALIAARYGAPDANDANGELPAPPTTLRDINPGLFRPGRALLRCVAGVAGKFRAALATDTRLPIRADAPDPAAAHLDRWGPLDFEQTVFDETATARVKEAARRGGCTVNTLFAAVLVRTIEELAPAAGRRRAVRLTIPVGLRAARDATKPGDAAAFGSFAIACNLRVPGSLATRALLDSVARRVAALRTTGCEHDMGAIQFLLPFMRRPRAQPFSSTFAWRAIGTNVFYSNPGVIAERFEQFGEASLPILEYAGMSCVLPPYVVSLFTPQVRGRLHLNVLYREGALEGGVAPFIAAWKGQLAALVEELLAV